MAEYFQGNIEIGGRLCDDSRRELVDLVLAEGMMSDWGSDNLEEAQVFELIVEAIQGGKSLKLYSDGASYGRFESLEKFCKDEGLTYVRYSSGYDEFQPEVSWYGPGMDNPAYQETDQDGEPTIGFTKLNCMMQQGAASFVLELREYIKERTPCDVPALVWA